MLNSIFTNSSITLQSLGICILVAFLLGLIIAVIHKITNNSSKKTS